jgi:hypothetical protein
MIEQLRRELNPMLPLIIKEATFIDPTLMLAGDSWAFSSPSAWRVIKGGVLDFAGAALRHRLWLGISSGCRSSLSPRSLQS